MTGTERDTVLGRVREALRDVPKTELAQDVDVPRGYRRGRADRDVIDLFDESAADYRATIRRTCVQQLPATIAEILDHRGIRRLVVPPGLPEGYLSSVWCEQIRDDQSVPVRELDGVDGVITTCALAIAVTGTIVLDGGPGQGRRALSLLPDYHLCVVRADQIAIDVPEAIGRLDPTRPLTLISGPSATSDIENDRVEGVHGPRTLDILIVLDHPTDTCLAEET